MEQFGGLISIFGVVLIAQPASLFSGLQEPTVGSGIGESTYSTNDSRSDSSGVKVTPTQRLAAVGVAMLGVLGAAVCYYPSINCFRTRLIIVPSHLVRIHGYPLDWATCTSAYIGELFCTLVHGG